eukprot:m.227920 g.227920  ORF g.227920 m.227920 type:complete len:201 (+) comp18822_c0_seq3:1337-1939(+)
MSLLLPDVNKTHKPAAATNHSLPTSTMSKCIPSFELDSPLVHKNSNHSQHGIVAEVVAKETTVVINAIKASSERDEPDVTVYCSDGPYSECQTDAGRWVVHGTGRLTNEGVELALSKPFVVRKGERRAFIIHNDSSAWAVRMSPPFPENSGRVICAEDQQLQLIQGPYLCNSNPFSAEGIREDRPFFGALFYDVDTVEGS